MALADIPREHYYHGGCMWRYQDSQGCEHLGHYERCYDHGGTDVSYSMRDCATGVATIVSGFLFTYAHPVSDCCAIRCRLLEACR